MSEAGQAAVAALDAQTKRARALVAGSGEAETKKDPPASETAPAAAAVDKKPAEEAAGAGDDDEPEPTPAREGTPDKALQKMQQDLAATVRKVEELSEKKAAGEELTAAEKEQIERGKTRLAKIKEKLEDYGVVFEGGTELAEQVLELTEDRELVGALLEDHEATKEQLNATRNEVAWMRAERKYPSTDVRKVWEKAATDAEERTKRKLATVWESLSEAQQRAAVKGEANELFDERCSAVEAKASGKSAAAATAAATTTTPANGAATGGSAAANNASTRTTVSSSIGAGNAAIDPVAAQLARARRLVRKSED